MFNLVYTVTALCYYLCYIEKKVCFLALYTLQIPELNK